MFFFPTFAENSDETESNTENSPLLNPLPQTPQTPRTPKRPCEFKTPATKSQKKAFFSCSSTIQYDRTDKIIENIEECAKYGGSTELKILCFVGHRMFNSSGKTYNNRKLANIFTALENAGEDFKSGYKNEMSYDEIVFLKLTLLLSDSDYIMLKKVLDPYVNLPCLKTLYTHIKKTALKSHDFIINEKVCGKSFDLKEVWTNAILDALENASDLKPENVPSVLFIFGSLGGDGFSGECERVGRDIDLDTAHRYIVGVKLARIMYFPNPEMWSVDPTEIFVEKSQAYFTLHPVAIIAGKENQALMEAIWKPLLEQQKNLKQFTINFKGKEIEIRFPKPTFCGDGKGIRNMLCLNGAYCYLCNLSEEEAQDIGKVKHGMPITRSTDKILSHYESLMKKYSKRSKSDQLKSFMDYFSSEIRQGITGKPIVEDDTLHLLKNLPTQHLYSHIFSFIKDIYYQMNSRNNTTSGKSVQEEKDDQKKKKHKKNIHNTKEKQRKKCDNCNKTYAGFCGLLTHAENGKNESCHEYYHRIYPRVLGHLKQNAKKEKETQKLEKKAQPLTDHQQILSDAKDRFTHKVKKEFNIAVNQVKLSGNGANIENFNTTRIFLDPSNRDRAVKLMNPREEEKEDLYKFFQEAHVILSVTNSIGKINCQKFGDYVKQAYVHWIEAFGKFRHLKNSLHWSLGHVVEMLALNGGYSLAENSENSVEASIKKYRYLTKHLSRQTSFIDNSEDCLNKLYFLSLYRVRKYSSVEDNTEQLGDDEDSHLIKSFLMYSEGSKDERKWSSQRKLILK